MQISKTIKLPDWIDHDIVDKIAIDDPFEQMKFVLKLAELNVEKNTGGPFAAAVFNQSTSEIVSVGTNLVVDSNCSIAHAEIVAITMAEEKLKTFRLDNNFVLVSSAQPCVMCNGALLWSGIKKLVFGATKKDVEEIVGFDEGPLHPNWVQEMNERGIEVEGGVLRERARMVLQDYKDKEGIVY